MLLNFKHLTFSNLVYIHFALELQLDVDALMSFYKFRKLNMTNKIFCIRQTVDIWISHPKKKVTPHRHWTIKYLTLSVFFFFRRPLSFLPSVHSSHSNALNWQALKWRQTQGAPQSWQCACWTLTEKMMKSRPLKKTHIGNPGRGGLWPTACLISSWIVQKKYVRALRVWCVCVFGAGKEGGRSVEISYVTDSRDTEEKRRS